MADETTEETQAKGKTASAGAASEKKARKDVPGNFSYSFTPARFKEALDALIGAERPPTFNRDFIETVLGISRHRRRRLGAARASRGV